MTKVVTSIGALQLVEEGRLFLDQSAGRLLPELGDGRILEGFDERSADEAMAVDRDFVRRLGV